MPPYAVTDLVTTGGEHEGKISEDVNARGTNATRGSRTLNARIQAIKTEYSKKGTVKSMPGADPSRFTLNPLIDACFVRMSNALTQIEHVQDTRDIVAAAGEMDEYHFHLRSLHNNATRYAGYETEAGFNPKPEDSIASVKGAVQNSLRPLELEVAQKCLEYWGSQQYPPRILDPDKFEVNVKGWKSIEKFRDAVASKWCCIDGPEHCLTDSAVDRRERGGTDYFGSSKSFTSLDQEIPDRDQAKVRERRLRRLTKRWRTVHGPER
jgi:hypothetical protein